MSKKTQILIIADHPEILATIVRLVNSNTEWEGIGVATSADAIVALGEHQVDLILMGTGVEPNEEDQLHDFVQNQNRAIPCIRHYGGGSGLLTTEINTALKTK